MRAPPDLRLVIFDWDGTLIDSVGNIVACTLRTLEDLGVEPVPEQTIRSALGLGIRETVELFCPGCDEQLFGRILATYRRHWLGEFGHRAQLFPGVEPLLAELAGAGYLLAVATAKGRAGLDRELERTGLRHRFAATRTVDEAPSKPHPGMVLGLLDELGVAAREALVVGDSTHDMQMAANAGVAGVAVCSGSHPRPELEAEEPLACLADATALRGWLAGAAVREQHA